MSRYYRLGLIGHPVSHSLSPTLHKAALDHFGLSGTYDLIDIRPEDLKVRVTELIANGFIGLNVTVPYKQELFSLADSLTEEAQLTRAINCMKVLPSGTIVAHNTDLGGFMQALTTLTAGKPGQGSAYILGTGGAARAAAHGLIKLEYPQIVIVGRNKERAEELIQQLGKRKNVSISLVDSLKNKEKPSLIVNATDIGVNDKELPAWAKDLMSFAAPEALLFDMVYAKAPDLTPFMRHAKVLGMTGIDGLDMLIEQAVLSFAFWTALICPQDIMRKAVDAKIVGDRLCSGTD